MKKLEIWLGILRLPVDFLFAWLALFLTWIFRGSDFGALLVSPVTESAVFMSQSEFMFFAVLLVAMLIPILAYNKLYSLKSSDSFSSQVRKVLVSVAVWVMAIITYYFLIRDFPFSRFVLLAGAFMMFLFISLGRMLIHNLQHYLLRKGIGVRKVVLIASHLVGTKKLFDALSRDYRYKVVGYMSDVKLTDSGCKKLGDIVDFEVICTQVQFDDVIQIGDLKGALANGDLVNLCRYYHKEYQYVPEVFEVQRHNIYMNELAGLPVFRVKPTPLDGWWRVVKRLIDVVASGLGLIVLSPFLLLVALVIKLDSKGPVFFRYLDDGTEVKRIGYKGQEFHCWKFRTMQNNTHGQRYNELSDNDYRKGSPLVKIKNDPRVTKLGKFLRRFDIDELPQLFNVLKGDMSLVGPRPHLNEEVAKYQKHHQFVLTVKPGITGMAQVSGRSDLEFEDEIKLDTYYIENWTLWLDVKILFKTALVVFRGHGEYK